MDHGASPFPAPQLGPPEMILNKKPWRNAAETLLTAFADGSSFSLLCALMISLSGREISICGSFFPAQIVHPKPWHWHTFTLTTSLNQIVIISPANSCQEPPIASSPGTLTRHVFRRKTRSFLLLKSSRSSSLPPQRSTGEHLVWLQS